MPRTTLALTSFTAGELSAKMDGRTDFEKYQSGCKTLENMLVHPQGAATRRVGTQFIAEVKTSSANVALHFLKWYEKKYTKPDGLLLLQPTSPFRKKSSIKKAIKFFKNNKNRTVVSFSPIIKEKSLEKARNFKKKLKINGSIYLISPKNLKKHKSFTKPSVLPLIQNSLKESVDIDTYDDWKIAKKLKK